MELINCHIENFGKLSGFDMSFTDGLNEVINENGWGKTTLSTFIKVMLYGFENEGKRAVEPERDKYRPWQGGEYGGRLTFKTGGKSYTICRIFGEKQKDDRFRLLDVATGQESDRFSMNIGQELLHIDRDTFFNTLYISQNDRSTQITDDIHARMGSQDNILGDISGYPDVEKKIKKMINENAPSKKSGSLSKLKTEISAMEQEQKNRSGLEKSEAEQKRMLDEEKEKALSLQEKKRHLQEERSKVTAYEAKLAKLKRYEELLEENNRRAEELKQAAKALPRVPEEKQISEYMEKNVALQKEKVELASRRLTDDEKARLQGLEQIFSEDVNEEQINKQIENVRALNSLKGDIHQKKSSLETIKIIEEQNKAIHKEKKYGNELYWKLPVGAIFTAVGVLVAIILNVVLGVVLSLIGIALLVWCFVPGKKSNKKDAETEKEPSKTDILEREIKENEERFNKLIETVHAFLSELNSDCADEKMDDQLYDLRSRFAEYEKLHAKAVSFEKSNIQERVDKLEGDILGFLREYTTHESTPENFESSLRSLERDTLTFKRCESEAKQAKMKLTAFAEQENVEELNNLIAPTTTQTADELDMAVGNVEEQATHVADNIRTYSVTLEKIASEIDELDERFKELEEKKEKYESVSEKYEILQQTKKYLEEAKNRLTNRYTEPLLDALSKYHETLSNGEESHYKVDVEMNVKLDIGIMPKNLSVLSRGYLDLSWLCMRFAFIDAMYPDDKPFIVMDDPFVNMDEKKIEGGKNLLNELAKDYQIIYFTCHESRKMER